MEVYIRDNKLRGAVKDETLPGQYGTAMAKKILLRLGALGAAHSLGDFWPPYSGPERCHELKGSLEGKFSFDLKQPYRLLFEPDDGTQPPDRSDEQKRWQSITSIDVLAIEDTHE